MSEETTKSVVLEKSVAGLLAEYDTPKAIYHAAEAVRDAGFTKWDVHTPFPIHGMDDAMGLKPTPLGWISLSGGITGGSLALLMQWWMNGHDYQLNIGGKPAFAVQAFVPVTFELTILLTAFATLFGMLGLNKLPQLYHWAFGSTKFQRATDDRFFISIERDDPKFDADRTRALLEKTHPLGIEVVEEDVPAVSSGAFRDNMGLTVEAIVGITSPLHREKDEAKHSHVVTAKDEAPPTAEGLDDQKAEHADTPPSEREKAVAEAKDAPSEPAQAPEAEAPKAEPKADEPKAEEPKAAVDEPKAEEPKAKVDDDENNAEATRVAKYSTEEIDRLRADIAADEEKKKREREGGDK